jgi:hypothetical protein
MSKKRQQDRRPSSTVTPSVAAEVLSPEAPVLTPSPASVQAPRPRLIQSAPERPRLVRCFVAVIKTFGSLQAAIALGFTFIIVLAAGTIIESWYSARVAQELVYRTWWFTVLLILLGLNIFFAAVKKWPWKRHQIGFLITHLGLLIILAGGVLNSLGGVDAQMVLLDSDKAAVIEEVSKRFGSIPHESGDIFVPDRGVIHVRRSRLGVERAFEFASGSFPWGDDQFTSDTPLALTILNWLAYPWPRSWRRDLGEGAHLEVLAFYPHARREPFSPAREGDIGFPAMKVFLETPFAGSLGFWLALNPMKPSQATETQFPSRTEFLGHCPRELLSEFLNPLTAEQAGPHGQLVIGHAGQTFRFDVARDQGKKLPLANGWFVEITAFIPADRIEGGLKEPIDPVVRFVLHRPDGRKEPWRWSYRAMTENGPESPTGRRVPPAVDAQSPAVWYHPPDVRAGATELRGLLQFVIDEKQQLYYRSFTESGPGFSLEAAGPVPVGSDPVDIWKGMKWKFSVAELLPRATEEARFIPEVVRPGLERREGADSLAPVISCRLSLTKSSTSGRSQTFTRDFQLAEGSSRVVRIRGTFDGAPFDEEFSIEYSYHRAQLGFRLRLLRFEMQVDRGTNKPATYTSFVQLFDQSLNLHGDNRVITMNQPLTHRGYKVYQSDYRFLLYDDVGRPVYYSGFTVGRDPGLWMKYLGSAMLALGIACMFYMKAYFFAPRRRSSSLNPASG